MPASTGVPLSAPALDNFKPLGREPLKIDQVYGACPPAAARLSEYAAPVVASGSGEAVAMVSCGSCVTAKALLAITKLALRGAPPLAATVTAIVAGPTSASYWVERR